MRELLPGGGTGEGAPLGGADGRARERPGGADKRANCAHEEEKGEEEEEEHVADIWGPQTDR